MSELIDRIRPIARLRAVLSEMEQDLGLEALTPGERDLLYAFVSESAAPGELVMTSSIRNNPILRDMSDPTVYRHISSLIDKGLLGLAPGRQRGAYVVRKCTLKEPE